MSWYVNNELLELMFFVIINSWFFFVRGIYVVGIFLVLLFLFLFFGLLFVVILFGVGVFLGNGEMLLVRNFMMILFRLLFGKNE